MGRERLRPWVPSANNLLNLTSRYTNQRNDTTAALGNTDASPLLAPFTTSSRVYGKLRKSFSSLSAARGEGGRRVAVCSQLYGKTPKVKEQGNGTHSFFSSSISMNICEPVAGEAMLSCVAAKAQ